MGDIGSADLGDRQPIPYLWDEPHVVYKPMTPRGKLPSSDCPYGLFDISMAFPKRTTMVAHERRVIASYKAHDEEARPQRPRAAPPPRGSPSRRGGRASAARAISGVMASRSSVSPTRRMSTRNRTGRPSSRSRGRGQGSSFASSSGEPSKRRRTRLTSSTLRERTQETFGTPNPGEFFAMRPKWLSDFRSGGTAQKTSDIAPLGESSSTPETLQAMISAWLSNSALGQGALEAFATAPLGEFSNRPEASRARTKTRLPDSPLRGKGQEASAAVSLGESSSRPKTSLPTILGYGQIEAEASTAQEATPTESLRRTRLPDSPLKERTQESSATAPQGAFSSRSEASPATVVGDDEAESSTARNPLPGKSLGRLEGSPATIVGDNQKKAATSAPPARAPPVPQRYANLSALSPPWAAVHEPGHLSDLGLVATQYEILRNTPADQSLSSSSKKIKMVATKTGNAPPIKLLSTAILREYLEDS
ncbi:uncharacterized protein LY89DRAFT_743810 [Mollisia scopiformis]|uniref:Uncharacterized protein n=1 Tax=Mollisia scopiformis TaxID=149040 RepID=A0A132B269_MOLSC|nr:uncharacterized protein LY89DRAFT_743810 [Mollisia scopiformis]KUJ06486.1 hypothetical protein LY89DRAFT_743810 [Mollisia scopiformis]